MKGILIVGKDVSMQRLMNDVLRRSHEDILLLDSSQSVLDALPQSHDCSLIIFDISSSSPKDFELLGSLKNRHPHAPIIAVTSRSDFYNEALSNGATCCMMKPFRAQELNHHVANLIH